MKFNIVKTFYLEIYKNKNKSFYMKAVFFQIQMSMTH